MYIFFFVDFLGGLPARTHTHLYAQPEPHYTMIRNPAERDPHSIRPPPPPPSRFVLLDCRVPGSREEFLTPLSPFGGIDRPEKSKKKKSSMSISQVLFELHLNAKGNKDSRWRGEKKYGDSNGRGGHHPITSGCFMVRPPMGMSQCQELVIFVYTFRIVNTPPKPTDNYQKKKTEKQFCCFKVSVHSWSFQIA